jgi:flavin-dependent dehydrogenase
VDGVVTSEGPVAARWVVDASGRRHWSARRLGSPVHRVSARLIASWGHLCAPPAGEDREPLLRADDDGWTWTARVGAGRWAWVRLDATGRGRLRGAPDGTVSTRPLGADVTWRRAAVTAAPGLLVAGDAAGVLDPASGSGVLRALVSGAVAAASLVEVAAGRSDEAAVAHGYRRWLAAWFRDDVHRLEELYRRLPCWPGLPSPGDGPA